MGILVVMSYYSCDIDMIFMRKAQDCTGICNVNYFITNISFIIPQGVTPDK